MKATGSGFAAALDVLEHRHGPQSPHWPVDPYEFLIWWHCGYPASDERCSRGWNALKTRIGVGVQQILGASQAELAEALKAGGMVPELRAARLQEIAQRTVQQYGGDLTALFRGDLAAVRRALKQFPGISDPGADRILLFAGKDTVAAVPSNCPHVAVRIVHGMEREEYAVTYREAQEIISAEVPREIAARQRAYLLLKVHGQELCKRKPLCSRCPLQRQCAYAAGIDRGTMRPEG